MSRIIYHYLPLFTSVHVTATANISDSVYDTPVVHARRIMCVIGIHDGSYVAVLVVTCIFNKYYHTHCCTVIARYGFVVLSNLWDALPHRYTGGEYEYCIKFISDPVFFYVVVIFFSFCFLLVGRLIPLLYAQQRRRNVDANTPR